MAGMIHWSKSDYLTLGRAVSQFNKRIKELETEENKLFLPEPMQYSQIKSEILTRSKLKDVLRSLRSFDSSTAELVTNVQTEQTMTAWESAENTIKQQRAIKQLTNQAKIIKQTIEREKYSRKSEDLKLQYLETLENLRDIKKIRQRTELPVETYKKMIQKLGNVDYNVLKQTIYRENFEKALLEGFKNFEGYELLKEKLERIKSPSYFYRYVRRAEHFRDIFVHYREGDGMSSITGTGEPTNDQLKFYKALEDIGLVDEQKNKYMRQFRREGNDELLKKAESISTAQDLMQFIDELKK